MVSAVGSVSVMGVACDHGRGDLVSWGRALGDKEVECTVKGAAD